MKLYGFTLERFGTTISVSGYSTLERAKLQVLQRFVEFGEWTPPARPVPFWKIWVRRDPCFEIWKALSFPNLQAN